MGGLLGSFLGCARVRPECARKICVGLYGQSTVSMSSYRRLERPGCYNWYLSNSANVADCVFSAPSGEKDPEITVQRERCIPKWG